MESKKFQTYSGYNIKVLSPYEEERQVQSQRSKAFYNIEKPLNEDLQIFQFKVYACDQKTQHNHKQCRYYHSNKDRRRMILLQSNQLCPTAHKHINNMSNQDYDFICPNGENCLKCHNKVEQLYCNDKYKTKFCTHYPNDCINCQYGEYCSFAHRQDEIRLELIHYYQQDTDFYIFHYKTLWCPFNYISHDRRQCIYSHNWQDYRRKPHIYNYEPVSCPYWNPNSFITKYENECKYQFNCDKCHGWKQLEYHPKNYKIKNCSSGMKCQKGKICPYVHTNIEKRKFSERIKSGFFIYYPRNRKIQEEKNNNTDYIKNYFNGDNSTKSQDEISDCSSEVSIKSKLQQDRQHQEQIQIMVKKLLDNDN